MKIQTLDDLFLENLKDVYNAEKQLLRALPKMAKAASSEDLRNAFREHTEQTKGQVTRLEQVFETLGQKAKSKTCNGMKGLVEEGQEVMEEDASDPFGDLGLIAAAQKVEHYEISAYGTLRTFALAMGQKEVAGMLQQTLQEEEATDKKLTGISKTLMKNAPRAEEEEDEEEVEVEEEEVEA
jgi:ferritin-like metal-binding protein YciE